MLSKKAGDPAVAGTRPAVVLAEAVSAVSALSRRVGWRRIGSPIATGAWHDMADAVRVVATVLSGRIVG